MTNKKQPAKPATTTEKPKMRFRFIFPVYIGNNTPLSSHITKNYSFEPSMAIIDGVLIPYTNIAQISPEEL